MKLNWNFLGGGGGEEEGLQNKKPSVGKGGSVIVHKSHVYI